MTTQTQNQIVNTILEQLGGMGRLKAMLNVEHFYKDNNGRTLVFDFPRSRKAKSCRITLNGLDLYDVEFQKDQTGKRITVATMNNVGCEELKSVFEDFTGLYLSL